MNQKVEPPARLGSKIAQNLGKQKVENLITEGSSQSNWNKNPQKKHSNIRMSENMQSRQQAAVVSDSFDRRLDKIIMETMNERETLEQQYSASKNAERIPKHLSIETKRSDCYLNNNAANAAQVLTPQLKSQSKNSKNLTKESSQSKLQTQRSGIFLKPIDDSKVRQSFEKNKQIE